MVDDESSIRSPLRSFLGTEGHDVAEAGRSRVAQNWYQVSEPTWPWWTTPFPDVTALDLLRRLKGLSTGYPGCEIITGHASVELPVRAIKQRHKTFWLNPRNSPASPQFSPGLIGPAPGLWIAGRHTQMSQNEGLTRERQENAGGKVNR